MTEPRPKDTKAILGDIIHHLKYARFIPDLRRRETWGETVGRNRAMHVKKFPDLVAEIDEAYEAVERRDILPSMRSLEDNTLIPTPDGWKPVGKITVGDKVFASNGSQYPVLAVQKFKDIELWDVQFSDGSILRASGDHLWITSTIDDRMNKKDGTPKTRIVNTDKIKETLYQQSGNDEYPVRYNHIVWNPSPLVLAEQELPLDPYILGLWLGDGFSTGYQFACHQDDSFLPEAYNFKGFPTKKQSNNPHLWGVSGLAPVLKSMDLIQNKHIPQQYLRSSFTQRLELVQGLMDTDGCTDKTGRSHFSNTNPRIIEGLKELLSSLGTKFVESVTEPTDRTKKLTTLSFFSSLPVHQLPRKAKNLRIKQSQRTKHRAIINILPAGRGNATCLVVDSPDHSYLAGKTMIVTHNSMQFSGPAMEKNPVRGFNCTYGPVDHPRFFAEALFLLLSGCGVGYSVQRHHIARLPPVRKPTKKQRHLIGDSIEGWAMAAEALANAYFSGCPWPDFDYSDIRPRGTPLKTSGGLAPGPLDLRASLEAMDEILKAKPNGSRLLSIEANDILCHLSQAVLAGGIRRSSYVCLFSIDDPDMLFCKEGRFYEHSPQRALANNSTVLHRREQGHREFRQVWDYLSNSASGEPGIFHTSDWSMGLNPCTEISLPAFGMCNLAEINGATVEDQRDLERRAILAARIATLQASRTQFHFLRPCWQESVEAERLIGIGITGISAGQVMNLDLKHAAQKVVEENARVARMIGISASARSTTIKPSGTTSLLLGCSSGVHPYYDRTYLRRVILNDNEPILGVLMRVAPELIEPALTNPKEFLLAFPIAAPQGAIVGTEETPIELLERIKRLHSEWIVPGHVSGKNTNNVSCTVTISPSDRDEVGKWLWTNRDSYTAISVLPKTTDVYKQMPFEACSGERFAELERVASRLGTLDEFSLHVRETRDNTKHQNEAACAGGACDVSFG